jgi:hypothetical protein
MRPITRRIRPFHVAAGALTTTATLGAAALAVAQADSQSAPVPMHLQHSRLSYGAKLVARGHLPDGAPRHVQLQLQPHGGNWTTIAEGDASAAGDYVLKARPRTSGAVRVVTVTAGAVASAAAAPASATRTLTVSARIRTHRHGVNVLEGRRGTLRGTVLPGAAGRAVAVQVRRHGHWSTLGHTTTRSGGRFSVAFRAHDPGSQLLRVTVAGDGATAGAHRRAGRLNVFRPSLASWYSLPGGHLACGGTMTAGTLGVANKSLPCGTMVTFRYRGHTVRVPVIDRGPYSGAREWDLSAATAHRLGFGGVGTVWSTA